MLSIKATHTELKKKLSHTDIFNHLHACIINYIVQMIIFFFKIFWDSNFHCHIWIEYEKFTQMSTDKPSIGAVVLGIVTWNVKKVSSKDLVYMIYKFGRSHCYIVQYQ